MKYRVHDMAILKEDVPGHRMHRGEPVTIVETHPLRDDGTEEYTVVLNDIFGNPQARAKVSVSVLGPLKTIGEW